MTQRLTLPNLRFFRSVTPVMIAAVLALSGCARSLGPNDYDRMAVGRVAHTEYGTVVSTRNVTIRGSRSGLGPGVGAVAGGVVGSTIGGGTPENVLGAIGGALIGGLIGSAVEEGATKQRGIQYTIEQPNGNVITVVQAEGGPVIAPGQNVRIVYAADRVRIEPDY